MRRLSVRRNWFRFYSFAVVTSRPRELSKRSSYTVFVPFKYLRSLVMSTLPTFAPSSLAQTVPTTFDFQTAIRDF